MNEKKLFQNLSVVFRGKVLHFLAFFFSTLISYYNYDLGFAPFALLSILIYSILALTYLKKFTTFPSRFLNVALLFLPIFLWALIVSVQSLSPFLYTRLIVFVFFLLISFYLDAESKSNFINLLYSINLSLKIHLTAFFIQAIYFYITNELVDFIEPITGEVSRVFGGNYNAVVGNQFIRPSGLFAEPGTYVSVVFPLYLFSKIVSHRIQAVNDNNFGFLDIFVFLSVLLAFSTFGYLFIALFILMNLINFDIKKSFILVLFTGCLVALSHDYFYQRFFSEDQYLDDYRLEMIMIFLYDNLNLLNLLFGYGYFSDLRQIFPYVIDDIGLWFSILFYFGFFVFLYFIFIFQRVWWNLSRLEKTLILCIFISKLIFTYIFLIFMVLFLFSNRKKII